MAFELREANQWFQDHVADLKPLKEGEPGYVVYKPGEGPFKTFNVWTSDKKASVEADKRLIRALRFANPELGETGEIKILADITKNEDKSKGRLLKIAFSNDLYKALQDLRFELQYGFGTIKLKGSRKSRAEEESAGPSTLTRELYDATTLIDSSGDVEVLDN